MDITNDYEAVIAAYKKEADTLWDAVEKYKEALERQKDLVKALERVIKAQEKQIAFLQGKPLPIES